jgi:hypothetical protein
MVEHTNSPKTKPYISLANYRVFKITGEVGCLTLLVVLAALAAGLWIDGQFNSKPLFTIILMVGSVPVTMLLLIRLVRRSVDEQPPETDPNQQLDEEENEGG